MTIEATLSNRRHTLTEIATVQELEPSDLMALGIERAVKDLRSRGAKTESEAVQVLIDEYRKDFPHRDYPSYPQVYAWLSGRRRQPRLDIGFRMLSLLTRRGYC